MRCLGPNRVKELPRQAASLVSKRLFLCKPKTKEAPHVHRQGAFRHHVKSERCTPAHVVRLSCSNSMNSRLIPRLSFDSGKEKNCAGHRHGSASQLCGVDQTSRAEYLNFDFVASSQALPALKVAIDDECSSSIATLAREGPGSRLLDFACCYAGLLGVFRRYNGSR